MRIDLPAFAGLNLAQNKSPRYVIGLIYTIASPHFTSHPGIANVPGVPIDNVLQNLSGTSQQLFPREGRSTISSFSFELADVAGAVTDELREQLTTNAEGLRGNDVRVFVGYTDDFNDFVRVQTPVVQDVTFDGTKYVIKCGDRTRQLRSKIFDIKKTNLDATLNATQTTITVVSTTAFELVQHTASFSDSPSALIGYVQIKESGEIISYTGKNATQFTGCTRELFGTKAKPVDFDATVIDDRKPEVLEFIYLEMPAPQMMLAIMTGEIDGTSPTDTLPAHWHLGLSPADIRTADYLNIGNDLYDTTDVNKGLVVRFTHLKKVTGKAFIEKELHLLIGTFAPVYSDGTIGLKRINKIPKDAAFTTEIGDNEIVKINAVQHDQNDLANQFQVDWNFNGEDFTRRIFFTDSTSISIHGTSDVLAFEFKGLHGSRHTDPLIRQRINALRDRYAAPPLRLTVEVIPSLNQIEIGDVVRINMPLLRDYTDTGPLLRSFEVQRAQVNWKTGAVSLTLFGSSALADSDPAISDVQALDDSYYNSQGVALSTVLTIAADHVTANGTVTGNADMNNTAAIFYHLADLTIDAGVVVTLINNVQLRVRGFLTIDGDLDGIGGGLAGTASPDTISTPVVTTGREGLPGYVGNSRSGDGIILIDGPFAPVFSQHWPGVHTLGHHLAFPALNLAAVKNGSPLVADQLDGLPTDLRGTSGGAGAPLLNKPQVVRAVGGAGGDSGAGLAIVCRGIGFGASGGIDLSGDDGLSVAVFAHQGKDYQPGSGGAGGPGSLFVGLDGNAIGFPDLTKFTAATGLVPFPGTNAIWRTDRFLGWIGPEPFAGLNDASQIISGAVLDNAALGIFYIPNPDQAAIDAIIGPIAPDSLVVTGISNALALAWDNVEQTDFLHIEVVRATSNDRSLGNIIAKPQGDEYTDPSSGTFFYWIRKVDADGIKSDFFPLSATAGITGTALDGPVSGSIQPENGLAWTRATNQGAWTPAQVTTDLDCVFRIDGADVARIARRVTLNTTDGTLTVGSIAHKGGDLNTGRVTVVISGSGTTALTVQFDYSDAGNVASTAATVNTVQGGDDGATGAPGSPGADGADGADAVSGFVEPENGLAWTRAPNAGAWTPSQATTDLDVTFKLGATVVARIARRVTLNTTDGTLTIGSIVHKGGDLNTSRVTVSILGSGTTALTAQFDYSFSGDSGSAAATVETAQGGDDGAAGAPGAPGADGADAVSGFVEPENGLAWTRAPNAGAWTPSQATTDLDVTFKLGTTVVARIARRVTLNTTDGTLTIGSIVHKDGDLNTSRVTVALLGSGTTALTAQFDYSFSGDEGSTAATIETAQGGDDGATGAPGSPGADGADGADAVGGFVEPENGLAWTRAPNNGAWTPSQLTTDLDVTFKLGSTVVARIARRITLNTADGTLTSASTPHKGGDLNTSRVTVTVSGSGSTAITDQFDYSFAGDDGSAAATVETTQAGFSSAFQNGFEAGPQFDAWTKPAAETGTLTAETTTVFSGAQSGAMDSTLADTDSPPPTSTGSTGSHRVEIPESLALLFAGQLVTVSVVARQALATPSGSFAVAYSTNDNGNSGWITFTPTAVFTKFSFDYQVPLPIAGGTDFLGIHPDLTGAGLDLIVDDVSVVIKGTGGEFIDTKFKRDPAQPATPTGDNPTGWTDTIPVGTDTVWQINGTKTAAGVLIGVWSTPATLQGLVFRGAYSATTAYIVNDVVTFSERSYICTQAGTGNDPTGTNAANAFWDLLAGKGDPGDPPTPFTETIVIGSQAGPVNLRALANAHTPAYDGIADATVTYTLAPGVLVTGAAGLAGIDTGVWPSAATIVLTVENQGTIRSGGGKGGKGGSGGNQNGSPGTTGGDAITCQEDLTVDNAPSAAGVIEAAGGGAGGGGGHTSGGGEPLQHGGGGGGGGFPNGAGGAKGVGDNPAQDGTAGSPGTTGGGGAGGTGSAGAGNGGGGGNVNVNGAAGANGVGGLQNGSGGAGGARGFAVRKNGHTVTVTGGTVTGQVG